MNKTSLITSTILALALGACAGSSAAAEETAAAPAVTYEGASALTLTVENVRAGRGPLMIAVFDSEAAWDGEASSLRGVRTDASGDTVTVTIADLPAGVYGLKIFQDLDADGGLDTNPFGIPTEPYGFSNDAPVRFGPPAWEAARFSVNAATVSHTISLPE